jgi:hypothetical protein
VVAAAVLEVEWLVVVDELGVDVVSALVPAGRIRASLPLSSLPPQPAGVITKITNTHVRRTFTMRPEGACFLTLTRNRAQRH